jgi:hypothetical protein
MDVTQNVSQLDMRLSKIFTDYENGLKFIFKSAVVAVAVDRIPHTSSNIIKTDTINCIEF